MKILHVIALILLIIGGLNWGLTAFDYNVVNMLLGTVPVVEKAVYILVGLSAIYTAITHKGDCKACSSEASA